MSFPYIKKSHLIPPTALGLSLLLRWWLPASWIEGIYSRGFFVAVRNVWDYTVGWSPIPVYYLFWLLIVYLLVRGLRKSFKQEGWQNKLLSLGGQLLRFTCYLGISFLWGWGYNYGREPVEHSMAFTPYEMSFDELKERVVAEADTLSQLRRKAVGADTTAVEQMPFTNGELEKIIRQLVAQGLSAGNYPAPGSPRGRQLYPKGVLLRFSTSGVYWPWAGEGNLDAGMHPLKKPPVLAHELAHAFGFGEEGTCSFWAWIAGRHTDNAWLEYAIRLDYWRNLARLWLRTDRAGYLAFYRNTLAPGIRQDIIAIIMTNRKYPDILPAVRDVAYDAYLKSQGVKEGLLSYGRVVKLVEGYRAKFD